MPEPRSKAALVLAALLLLYPLAVYFGLQHLQPRLLGALLLALLALRWLLLRRSGGPALRQLYLPLLTAALCALAALAFNSTDGLRLLPVAINGICLLSFAATLWRGPSMIERFARAWNPAFPTVAVPYTRRVTQVWCGFFLLNGTVALYTALYASLALWTLYNGLVSYLLMGLLFGGEVLLRRYRFGAAVG
jgi:uncharacterized membrane protein